MTIGDEKKPWFQPGIGKWSGNDVGTHESHTRQASWDRNLGVQTFWSHTKPDFNQLVNLEISYTKVSLVIQAFLVLRNQLVARIVRQS